MFSDRLTGQVTDFQSAVNPLSDNLVLDVLTALLTHAVKIIVIRNLNISSLSSQSCLVIIVYVDHLYT